MYPGGGVDAPNGPSKNSYLGSRFNRCCRSARSLGSPEILTRNDAGAAGPLEGRPANPNPRRVHPRHSRNGANASLFGLRGLEKRGLAPRLETDSRFSVRSRMARAVSGEHPWKNHTNQKKW